MSASSEDLQPYSDSYLYAYPFPWASQSPTNEQGYSSSDAQFLPPKRQRLIPPCQTLNGTVDRISPLPDSILLHILSFLRIEEAISTGILSKRWQYLWTNMPNLKFHHRRGTNLDYRFVRFVDKTLIQCGGAKINMFMLEFCYYSRFRSNVDMWIRFALKNNVQDLLLLFSRFSFCLQRLYDAYPLPPHLYNNSTITMLSLSACKFEPKCYISWKSLKSLSIGCVQLSDDLMLKILLGSPMLEYLELYDFYGIDKLDITSPTLKKLVVRDYYGKTIIGEQRNDEELHEDEPNGEIRDSVLEIWAPNLHSLNLIGCFNQNKCRLMNVQSLLDANLNFNLVKIGGHYPEGYKEMLVELLGKLHHVQSLTMGTWCVQVLSTLEKVGLSSPLSKRNILTVDACIKKQDLFGITNLLASSPDLQTLVINMNPQNNSELCLHDDNDETWVFNCSSLNLKLIKIVNFIQGRHIFELVRFLLENSMVLEKMIIEAQMTTSCETVSTSKELLSFPRASPRAVIIYSK